MNEDKLHLKVCGVLYAMLEAAQAGGMTEKRAKVLYNEIQEDYLNTRKGFSAALLKDIATILKHKG
jgi:hypothetical protein